MAITFFPRPKHRVFNYTPRYYDERKERLKELYAKYGKEYPGDDKASAQQAAKDLEDLAAPGEVREVMDIENGKRQNRSGAAYIPGQYIRSAYRKDTANNSLANSLIVAEIMDEIRRQGEVSFPAD